MDPLHFVSKIQPRVVRRVCNDNDDQYNYLFHFDYLKQFEKEQGIIIADQTGIGKGRQAAAVIRHAVMNDYIPVFFTKKPDLFTDMYRDLKAIGFENIRPFIVILFFKYSILAFLNF